MMRALHELLALIELGWEYPDAHSHVCVRFRVDGDELAELYDNAAQR